VAKDEDVSDEAAANPFRFQGFYKDAETGTYDMQARAYQPSTGRFLQQDRFEDPEADLTLASDPLTNSRYAFTAGNPSTYSEDDGHMRMDDSGIQQRDKQNRDAAAKGADSPGRQYERGVYQEAVKQQEEYEQRTGQPLKGIGSSLTPPPPLKVAEAASGSGAGAFLSKLIDQPVYRNPLRGDGPSARQIGEGFKAEGQRVFETYLRPQNCTMVVEAGCSAGLRLGDPTRSTRGQKALDLASALSGVAGIATRGAVSATTADVLRSAAGRASSSVAAGKGPVYGTKVHTAFQRQVEALGRQDLFTEIAYKNGFEVTRGTKGSVRLDVVEGSREAPTAIYDLKTGSAQLTESRINQIRGHLPPGARKIPIQEVRP
jgi:RHS repeat-associated protein